ncbi:MAG: M28 family peptidase, partial [Longimicrobiales bacterium]
MQIRIDELRDEIRATTHPPFDAAGVLDAIAKPRLTGTRGAADVTAEVRARLEKLGYGVVDVPFTFSTWPGRYALSAAGGALTAAAIIAGVFLLSGEPAAAIVVLALAAVAVAGIGLLAGRAIEGLRWGRQTAVNLLARRPDIRPRYVVMAHRDSKSQIVPLLLRAPALVVAFLGWAALMLLAILSLADPVAAWLAFTVALAAVIAATIITLCWAENDSPGALDNASGVAALIGIAARERERGDVAFLVTDAEELGLAGARAMARRMPAVFGVINLDGLDDDGSFHLLERFGWPRRGAAPHLAL